MNHRKTLELALEAFKSGDLRDIEPAVDAIKEALSEPSMTECTPLQRFINESSKIKTEMIKELIAEREAYISQIDDYRETIQILQAEIRRINKLQAGS